MPQGSSAVRPTNGLYLFFIPVAIIRVSRIRNFKFINAQQKKSIYLHKNTKHTDEDNRSDLNMLVKSNNTWLNVFINELLLVFHISIKHV